MAAEVSITDSAAERINQIVSHENKQGQGLRLKVIGGGCSGLQNKLDFDQPKPGDRVFEKNGAKVLVDLKSLLYLNGTELDYKETLMQSGFVLQNPNVKRTCGCGASFTV
jgi:iron-sulfur cluster assembly accessory protein